MTHPDHIHFNDELTALDVAERLDGLIDSKAEWIIGEKAKGRNMYAQEKELNTIYEAKVLIQGLVGGFRENLKATIGRCNLELAKEIRKNRERRNEIEALKSAVRIYSSMLDTQYELFRRQFDLYLRKYHEHEPAETAVLIERMTAEFPQLFENQTTHPNAES